MLLTPGGCSNSSSPGCGWSIFTDLSPPAPLAERKPSRKTRTNHLYMESSKCPYSPPTSSPWTRRPLLTALGVWSRNNVKWCHMSDSRKPQGGVHQSLLHHTAAWQLSSWGWTRVAGSVLFSKVLVVAWSQEKSLFYANLCIYGGMGVGGGCGRGWWGAVEQSGHVAPGRQAEWWRKRARFKRPCLGKE